MSIEYILLVSGLGLITLDRWVRGQALGHLGSAVLIGLLAAKLSQGGFWNAFTVGALVSLLASAMYESLMQRASQDLTTLVTACSNLIGRRVTVVEAIDPWRKRGKVRLDDEIVSAEASAAIGEGSEVGLDRIEPGVIIVREEDR